MSTKAESSSLFHGHRYYIRLILVTFILITCLYCTLYYTGFLKNYESPPSTIHYPIPQDQIALHLSAVHNEVIEKPVPVVPVLEKDWKVKLPDNYKGVPDHVYKTDWWMAAAFLEWDLRNRAVDYKCKKVKNVGNWWICMDKPFIIKPPCLVYSFGIANDFSFDDDMAKHGCEVHSFDPSMKTDDYTRNTSVHFHAIGIGGHTVEKFNPRKDMYVKDNTTWTIMTLNLIKTALGHKNRKIDVLKIDVEGHEWAVIENLLRDNVFTNVKQFMLEYHLFPDWPAKSDYSKVLRTYKKLHDLGLSKFVTAMHPCTHIPEKFNIQADVAYVNKKYLSNKGS